LLGMALAVWREYAGSTPHPTPHTLIHLGPVTLHHPSLVAKKFLHNCDTIPTIFLLCSNSYYQIISLLQQIELNDFLEAGIYAT